MRRGFGWGAAILGILLLVGVGVGAYNWGLHQGLEQSGSVEVVRHVGGHGFGFFPFFPFFLFIPLLLLAIFAFRMPWGRHWDHEHDHGPGPGPRDRWEQRIDELHRRMHEREGGGAGPPDQGGAGAGDRPPSA